MRKIHPRSTRYPVAQMISRNRSISTLSALIENSLYVFDSKRLWSLGASYLILRQTVFNSFDIAKQNVIQCRDLPRPSIHSIHLPLQSRLKAFCGSITDIVCVRASCNSAPGRPQHIGNMHEVTVFYSNWTATRCMLNTFIVTLSKYMRAELNYHLFWCTILMW